MGVRVTADGTVVIPQDLVARAGLGPMAEVEITLTSGGELVVRSGRPDRPEPGSADARARAEEVIRLLENSKADRSLTTDEVMKLTRDIDPPAR